MVNPSGSLIVLFTICAAIVLNFGAYGQISPSAYQPGKGSLPMSEEIVLRDLFDRWERVWHEGQYDLVRLCVQSNYVRHDEAGDRTVTREAYAAEIA